jgi:hypothetical protein
MYHVLYDVAQRQVIKEQVKKKADIVVSLRAGLNNFHKLKNGSSRNAIVPYHDEGTECRSG